MAAFEFQETGLGDELSMIRSQARRFVETEVIPHAERWEAEGRLPREVFRKLGAIGLLGMRHPQAHGGGGLGPLASAVFGEELGRSGYGGFCMSVGVHSDMSISYIAQHGSDQQKERYLPAACAGEKIGAICVTEPHAGSDVAGIRTHAVRDGEVWIIDGSKTYITNGVHGDIYVVAARTGGEAKGSRGLSLFLVDKGTPGFTVGRALDKQGCHCADTAELFFDDMRLPADALLGEAGRGFHYLMGAFQNERLVAGAMAVGQCARAIDVTLEHLKQRTAFGKTLWEQPVVRNKLAWLAAKAAAARSLTYSCARTMEAGADAVREVSMLKACACETLQEVVHGCLQLHGGSGYMTGTPIERMVRDARVMTIAGGATEVMLEEVAKRM